MEALQNAVEVRKVQSAKQASRACLRGLMMSWLHGVSTGMHGLLLAGFALSQFILSPHQYKFMTDLTGGGERKSLSKSMCG